MIQQLSCFLKSLQAFQESKKQQPNKDIPETFYKVSSFPSHWRRHDVIDAQVLFIRIRTKSPAENFRLFV